MPECCSPWCRVGELRGLLPGGADRVANAVAHLREVIDEDSPDGLIILWKNRAEDGSGVFFNSIFGEVLETDLAYFAAILLKRAVERPG